MKRTMTMILVLAVGLIFVAAAGKEVKKTAPKPALKKEKVVLKHYKENDPRSRTDNTIVVMKEGKEIELPVASELSESRFNPFKGREVNITTSYTPETGDYTVTHVEPFAN